MRQSSWKGVSSVTEWWITHCGVLGALVGAGGPPAGWGLGSVRGLLRSGVSKGCGGEAGLSCRCHLCHRVSPPFLLFVKWAVFPGSVPTERRTSVGVPWGEILKELFDPYLAHVVWDSTQLPRGSNTRQPSSVYSMCPRDATNLFNVLLHLSELLENVTLIHKPVSLQPRGLINKGNWCYINAVSFSSAVPGAGRPRLALPCAFAPCGCLGASPWKFESKDFVPCLVCLPCL